MSGFILLVLLNFLLGEPAAASPLECVSACSVITSIRDIAVAARASGTEAVKPRIRSLFDVDAMGQGVLAGVWTRASSAERRGFADVMVDQIVRSLVRRIGPHPEALQYLGERRISGGDLLANSRLTVGPSVVNLDWRLRRASGVLRVLDILIDGRSVMASRRDDYAGRLAANGNSIQSLTLSLRDELALSAN